jgi:hypothetical protein
MSLEQGTPRPFITEHRQRLLDLLGQNIALLRLLLNKTQQRMNVARRAALAQPTVVAYAPSLSRCTEGSAQ